MWAPQPETFTTTASTSAASNTSIVRARVRVQRAAAGLRARRRHLGPVAREHTSRGAVLRAKDDLLDAAGQHAHARPPGPFGGRQLGKRRALGRGRERG